MEDILEVWRPSTLSIVAVTAVLSVYVLYLSVFKKSTRKLPPGPREWGTTLQIFKAIRNETLHELVFDWARKYGQMTYVNFLGQQMLFLNSADIVRRLLGADEYKFDVADRIITQATRLGSYVTKDWVFTDYDAVVRKKRRLFHNVIGLYGDGKDRFENIVSGEMDRLLAELANFENQDIQLHGFISRSLKTIIYILTMGERPSNDEIPSILEEYDMNYNRMLMFEYDLPLACCPFLGKIPGKLKDLKDRLKKSQIAAEELLYSIPKKSWTPGKPRGIADHLFDLENSPDYEWMKDNPEHAKAFLTVLFWTAQVTSRASILGAFLCLLNNPRVTKKLHEEIDLVLGDRKAKLEDKTNMPYFEATILEVLRFVSQVPIGGSRKTSKDINIDGVTIPKNTSISLNAWYYHRTEELWEDPSIFKPERFLNSQGQLLKADHPVRRSVLPFGAGLRSCPGEIFARSRVFLFLTYILQKFDVLPPVNEKPVPADFSTNYEETKGFVRQAPVFKCRLQLRQSKIQ